MAYQTQPVGNEQNENAVYAHAVPRTASLWSPHVSRLVAGIQRLICGVFTRNLSAFRVTEVRVTASDTAVRRVAARMCVCLSASNYTRTVHCGTSEWSGRCIDRLWWHTKSLKSWFSFSVHGWFRAICKRGGGGSNPPWTVKEKKSYNFLGKNSPHRYLHLPLTKDFIMNICTSEQENNK